MPKTVYDPAVRERAMQLRDQGWSAARIGRELDVPEKTIYSWSGGRGANAASRRRAEPVSYLPERITIAANADGPPRRVSPSESRQGLAAAGFELADYIRPPAITRDDLERFVEEQLSVVLGVAVQRATTGVLDFEPSVSRDDVLDAAADVLRDAPEIDRLLKRIRGERG